MGQDGRPLGLQHGHRLHPGRSRVLVYSVNSTDAKGSDMNQVALNLMVAAFGRP